MSCFSWRDWSLLLASTGAPRVGKAAQGGNWGAEAGGAVSHHRDCSERTGTLTEIKVLVKHQSNVLVGGGGGVGSGVEVTKGRAQSQFLVLALASCQVWGY